MIPPIHLRYIIFSGAFGNEIQKQAGHQQAKKSQLVMERLLRRIYHLGEVSVDCSEVEQQVWLDLKLFKKLK